MMFGQYFTITLILVGVLLAINADAERQRGKQQRGHQQRQNPNTKAIRGNGQPQFGLYMFFKTVNYKIRHCHPDCNSGRASAAADCNRCCGTYRPTMYKAYVPTGKCVRGRKDMYCQCHGKKP